MLLTFNRLAGLIAIFSVGLTSSLRAEEEKVVPTKCYEVERYGKEKENIHSICDVPVSTGKTKKLHVLNLEGTFRDVSYAHGYLLAKETDQGVLGDMGPLVANGLAKTKPEVRAFAQCLVDKMDGSVSLEFSEGVRSFYNGYLAKAEKEAAAKSPWKPFLTDEARTKGIQPFLLFKLIAYGIELENVSDAIKHNLIDSPLVYKLKHLSNTKFSLNAFGENKRELQKVYGHLSEIVKECGAPVGLVGLEHLKSNIPSPIAVFNVLSYLALETNPISLFLKAFMPLGQRKFGCTGFVSPRSSSKEDAEGNPQFIHARNLDADTVNSWNKEPALYFVSEKDENGKPFAKYVSPGTAGMFYTGGVGGMNEYGITTSLHQMYTNRYQIAFPDRSADIAPFTNQKVLRKAQNLKDAEDVIRGIKHYGAWTEVIGDSKTDEIVSIEISSQGVDIGEKRKTRNEFLAQSNHFLSGIKDSAYTPYFNKFLESRSRFNVVEKMIQEKMALAGADKNVDVDYAIRILSNHQDYYEDGERSFGRTAAKAYGVMSTVMVPKKKMDRNDVVTSEFWMTMGEETGDEVSPRTTASHTTFIGFDIDWKAKTLTPIAETKRNKEWDHLPNWKKSLATYITARTAYQVEDKQKALKLLSLAIEQAEMDIPSEETEGRKIKHLAYYYMRARLLNELGQYDAAIKDWEYLWGHYHYLGKSFPNAYQRALVAIYSIGTKAQKGGKAYKLSPMDKLRVQTGLEILNNRQGEGADHYDLNRKIDYANSILKSPKKVTAPPTGLDFVFIE